MNSFIKKNILKKTKEVKERIGGAYSSGMTIVELLAVIVIMGIVAAIAVPTVGNLIENQRGKAAAIDANVAMEALRLYYMDNPTTLTVVYTDDPDYTPLTGEINPELDLTQLETDIAAYTSNANIDLVGFTIKVSTAGQVSVVDYDEGTTASTADGYGMDISSNQFVYDADDVTA